ncbi:hypothetical protein CAEBREN_30012 [Caenorhabditis brenneri]|uniref:FYVE-type domain-containing protein n=1 Tax=Caenorhabditis brenneri TaxID=135651 RepID=G0PL94_CAEBE|nr:hypothetical protein CAEBREN_30012 [Caenorhabditis brenneri]
MPSSICCTNCRTKYSLLNREAGCSNCALSFCKKCLSHRAIIPTLSDQPMIVCNNCYQKLEAAKLKDVTVSITTAPLPSSQSQSANKNWWGEGLPPPSFRSTYGNQKQHTNRATTSIQNRNTPVPPVTHQQQQPQHYPIEDLEQRRAKLREDIAPPVEPLSISEIEERLAKLRECDVDVIRNPRSWLKSSTNETPAINANNPAELMRIAEDRARIEQKEEEMEAKDWEELEARRRRIFDEKEHGEEGREGEETSVRESMVSGNTEFSEATKEEMNEINNLLMDAEKRVTETKRQEEHDAAELRSLMKATRQKSLDAMQWNEKITKEIGGFWDRQNEKGSKEEEDDDDEKSLDEETFKKIMQEAENSPDIEPPAQLKKTTDTTASNPSNSPKKKGFFEKLFRKDSKQ